MRSLLPTLAFALLAAPALASSIEPVASGGKGQGSIQAISCADCPALKEKKKVSTYIVPELQPGTQKVEIRDVDGEKKIFRSEAWLGGSPVVFVSKAPEQPADETTAEAPAEAINIVDPQATGALDAKAAGHAVTAAAATDEAGSRELDPSTFELRLN